MTIKSWLREFYPVPAHILQDASELACLMHSLRKWRGVKAENLARHGVTYNRGFLYEEGAEGWMLAEDTCALCCKHSAGSIVTDCSKCCLDSCNKSYVAAVNRNDIAPMLKQLEDTLERMKNERQT